MTIRLPALSLVVLVGASGSGKSTFARRHFLPTEVVSSDYCRGVVADDETDQSATTAAFEVLHVIAAKRLQGGRLTVIDATNVQPEPRRQLIELARRYHVLPVVVVACVMVTLSIPEYQRWRYRPVAPAVSSATEIRTPAATVRRRTQRLRRRGSGGESWSKNVGGTLR